jgi:hypothetical protein
VTVPAKKRLWISVASAATVTAVVVAFLVFTSGAATAKEFATLHPLGGTVELKPAGESAFVPGSEGRTLKTGDVVRTGADGRAEIEYFDGSVTRLDVSTTFEITELASVTDVPDSKIIEGSQEGGRTLSRVVALTDSESRVGVETPNAVASVQGTEFVTIVKLDGTSEYWLLEGVLRVKGDQGGTVVLRAGQGVSVGTDGVVGAPFVLSDAQLGLLCGFIDAGQPCEEPEVEPKPKKKPKKDPEPPPTDEVTFIPEITEITETTETATTAPENPTGGGPEDTDPPATSITSGPPGRTRSQIATFGFVSSEQGSTFQCSLDLGPFNPCSTGKTYSGLGDATHSFAVVATDGAGNVDPTPAHWTWRVDFTGPDTSITSGPPGNTTATGATFRFNSSEPNSDFTCQLDGSAAQACGNGSSSMKSYSGLGLGDHVFHVWATDNLGNVDASPARFTWTILDEGTDPKNHAPVASRPDNVFTRQGQPVSFNLVANDPDHTDELTFHLVSPPAHGSLSLNGASATYTPDPGFEGLDDFQWKVNDGQVDSNIATTTIHVRPAATGGSAQGFPEDASRALVVGDNPEGFERNDGADGGTAGGIDGGGGGGTGGGDAGGDGGGDGGADGGGAGGDPDPGGGSDDPGGGGDSGGGGGSGGGTDPGPGPSPDPEPSPEPPPPPPEDPPGNGNGNGNANGHGNGNGNGNGNGKH